MTKSAPRQLMRRFLFVFVLAATLATTLAPSVAGQNASGPEDYLLRLINAARVDMERVPLQWDARLADVAQWRSDDMVANNYFGHTTWERLSEKIAAKKIVWHGLGEAIVKGTPRPEMDSAEEALRTWQASSPHWNLLSSADFNYIALGVARDGDGWYYWTALLLKGPDRTAPVASMSNASLRTSSGTTREVGVSWSGSDVPLQVLTAGLKDYRVQMRVGSGRWTLAADWTSATSRTFRLQPGKTYSFRVRARDMSGNMSVWSAPTTVKV